MGGTSLPPFTGDTPPTRDVKVKRSRSSITDVRKSLESRLVSGSREVSVSSGTSEPRIVPEGNEPRLLSGTSESRLMSRQLPENSTLAAVADSKLQRELEDYFQKYGSIQRSRSKQ